MVFKAERTAQNENVWPLLYRGELIYGLKVPDVCICIGICFCLLKQNVSGRAACRATR